MSHMTQAKLARRLGVSRQAVGCALGNYPPCSIKLSPQTRRRILETARRMRYVPNHAARRMARIRPDRRSTSFDQVGLVYLPLPGEPSAYVDTVCLAMMQGAEHELSKLHASLTFVRVSEPDDWEKVERLTRAGSLDGWLLYGAVNDEVLNRLTLPFVIVGDHRCAQPVHCVTVDCAATGRLAAEHLAKLGHRRIGYIGGSMRFVYQEQMLAGYRAGVREFRLDEDERLVVGVNYRTDPTLNGLKVWLRNLKQQPTALFSTEPGVSDRLLRALRELEIEVPRDLSLLACEVADSGAINSDLTRIEWPITELGRQGALLLHRCVVERPPARREIKLSPTLIEGHSTCAPSNGTGQMTKPFPTK